MLLVLLIRFFVYLDMTLLDKLKIIIDELPNMPREPQKWYYKGVEYNNFTDCYNRMKQDKSQSCGKPAR